MRPARLLPADELSAFHLERAGTYHALALLLGSRPDGRSLDDVRATLDQATWTRVESPARAQLRAALEATSPALACADHAWLLAHVDDAAWRRMCLADRDRQAAFDAAALRPTDDAGAELRLMAVLAERTAAALDARSYVEAVQFSDAQGAFLALHAAECSARLAGVLRASPALFYSRLGTVLARLIADDLRLLGYSLPPLGG